MNDITSRLISDSALRANVRSPVPTAPVVRRQEASAVNETVEMQEPGLLAQGVPGAEETLDGRALPPEDPRPRSDVALADGGVERLTHRIQSLRRELQFTVDEVSGRTVITVRDPEADRVIRQIPSEEVLRLARRLKDQIEDSVQGLLLSARA